LSRKRKQANARDVSRSGGGGSKRPRYQLQLYVAGLTYQSTLAILNIKTICDAYLAGRYDLSVVDLYQEPGSAKNQHIVAVPTLVKRWPLPLRRLVGNLSQTERVLAGLDVQPE
jgi:circadian clock protein KaiB